MSTNPSPILVSGVCQRCGCTDARPCEGGCFWVDPEHTLCSRCAGPPAVTPVLGLGVDDETCPDCGGAGVIITCCDDICVGSGSCIHGDGDEICPSCGGDGVIYVGDPEDFDL